MRTLIEHLSQKGNSENILNSAKELTVPNVLHAKNRMDYSECTLMHLNLSVYLARKKDFPKWH